MGSKCLVYEIPKDLNGLAFSALSGVVSVMYGMGLPSESVE